jgi:acetyl-CoA carboxylase biotin carboxylase subunit
LHLGQVSYDQLPLNPPGSEDSKGTRLSGAIRIACPFLFTTTKGEMRTITKVLIANRGEIALRIIRTCREMGISTVAVHSEADISSPFVLAADETVCIGPPPSSESYLLIDKVLGAAKSTGSDAIHPGYGFLSENADFAEAVENAGMAFIGPKPSSIRTMGDKLAAKEAVQKRNIPLVPGTEGAIADPEEAVREAAKIGMPLIIKASAGGGGKGMRAVYDEAMVEDELARAISEAERSFGNGAVFMERLVLKPRHIEIQVLADTHGNVVHLFERECSIQRRHQKVVEEAPSALLDDKLREEMGACAVEVAKSCDYVGAGTVEFLVDENRDFFFLEMNTRLQVEHPVTECITGIDLVREQIRIAEGHSLSFSQEDLSINGHAIELRVYAEDASAGFLPCTGTLSRYSVPVGPGIRVDDGIAEGGEVSIHYDPMLSKLIAHGPTREACIDRLIAAIDNYDIIGVKTTLDFGRFAVDHEAFRSGVFDTGFVSDYFSPEKLVRELPVSDEIFAELVAGLATRIMNEGCNVSTVENVGRSPWRNRAILRG